MRRSDPGFTLLEVMAAVAVVAIVFTTLARVANQGMQSQGVSKRRLEASLLADQVLSDIEADMAAGAAPAIGQTEFEEGRFVVVVGVTAFDLVSAIPASAETTASELGLAPRTASAAGTSIIASAVRAIQIAVTWIEGADEFRVLRSTYGFDLASVQPALEASAGGLGPNTAAGGTAR